MKIKQIERQDSLEHPAGVMIELTYDGRKLESLWHISSTTMTAKMKRNPGVKFYNGNGELKGHLLLTAHGEYHFREYKKPKPEIQTSQGVMEFWNEVETIDKAQDLLDGFRHGGRPAACLHKHGLHQVYIKK